MSNSVIRGAEFGQIGVGAWVAVTSFTLVLVLSFASSIVFTEASRTLFSILIMAVIGLTVGISIRQNLHILSFEKRSLFRFILKMYFLLTFSIGIYQVVQVPLMGWDVVSHYAAEAIRFNEEVQVVGAGLPFKVKYIHPPTMPALLALLSFFSQYSGTFIYLFLWACMGLLFSDMAKILGGSEEALWISLAVFFSLPLVDNHLIHFGYAELWVAILVVSSLLAGWLSCIADDWRFLVLALIPCVGIVLLRDSWMLWVIPLVILWCFILLIQRQLYSFIWLPLVAMISALVFVSQETFLIKFTEFERLGVVHHDKGATVWLGQRPVAISLQPLEEVVSVVAQSITLNASFSIVLLLWTLSSFAYFRQRRGVVSATDLIVAFPLLLLFVLFLGCLLSEFFLTFYAVSDTGLSRFLLPWVGSMVFSVLVIMCHLRSTETSSRFKFY